MKLNEMYPSRWLKAGDVVKPVLATIKTTSIEELGDGEEKPVLYFEGSTKPMVLNRTNSTTIGDLYGEDTEDWKGKKIVLFSMKVQFRDRLVDAIRVRAPKATYNAIPVRQAPESEPEELDDISAF